jgi:hypothetical protein
LRSRKRVFTASAAVRSGVKLDLAGSSANVGVDIAASSDTGKFALGVSLKYCTEAVRMIEPNKLSIKTLLKLYLRIVSNIYTQLLKLIII